MAVLREKAGIALAIPEPSTANTAQIPFWIENIHPELVTFVWPNTPRGRYQAQKKAHRPKLRNPGLRFEWGAPKFTKSELRRMLLLRQYGELYKTLAEWVLDYVLALNSAKKHFETICPLMKLLSVEKNTKVEKSKVPLFVRWEKSVVQ